MPRDIRVGDKVRLLGWEGMLEGFGFTPKMAELAGTIVTVGDIISPYDEPYIKVNHWAWPLSSVEPLDAPRPSAWTKTSEGKPDVDKVVVGLWSGLPSVNRCKFKGGTRWESVDGFPLPAPDFWIDEPEVSK